MEFKEMVIDNNTIKECKRVGSIRNYYGGLYIAMIDDKPHMGIEEHSETIWEEIKLPLYNELKKISSSPTDYKGNVIKISGRHIKTVIDGI